MAIPVHVVSKLNNAQHAVCRIDEKSPTLAASSVRVKTWLISMTSNNLTYARAGGPLHWWDVYPVPESNPAPYNNQQEWGIVPAWGYGRVIDSNIDAISAGSLLWGMWPTSGHSVDLQLNASEPSGHWSEVSPHRGQLMTVYNCYEQVAPFDASDMQTTALCKPLWMGPYLLNTSVFSSQRIHPFGFGAPWSEEDADLSSAVVVNLSASSKTGRGFYWELAQNRELKANGPLAILQLTSAPHTIPQYQSALPAKSASYDDTNAISWTKQFNPSRIVIVDFGVSDELLNSLVSSASAIAKVTVVAVGYEAKVYKPEEIQARMAAAKSKVQVNTSGIRDHALKHYGPSKYFRAQDKTWSRILEEKAFSDLQVKVLKAVEGPEGIEGAWSDLCNRKVPANLGMIIDLSKE